MHGDCASQAKQSQLQSTHLNQPTRSLVNHIQILDIVLSSPKLLHHPNILNQTPDGEYWNWESDCPSE
jgi:hypothetical protein